MRKMLMKIIGLLPLFGLLVCGSASAMTEDEIYKNVMANIMSECYNAGVLTKTINLGEYTDFRTSVIMDGAPSGSLLIPTGIGAGNVAIPADGTKGTSARTCPELFMGGGSLQNNMGLFGLFGKKEPRKGDADLSGELSSLGWSKIEAKSSDLVCINTSYANAGGRGAKPHSAGTICWKESDLDSISNGDELVSKAQVTGGDGTMRVNLDVASGNVSLRYVLSQSYTDSNGNVFTKGEECSTSGWGVGEVSASGVIDNLAGATCDIRSSTNGSVGLSISASKTTRAGSLDSTTTVSIPGTYLAAYESARGYFAGNSTMYQFSKTDKLDLYNLYLDKVYKVQSESGSCLTRSEVAANGGVASSAGYYRYQSGKYCPIFVGESEADIDVSVFGSNDYRLTEYCTNVECLLNRIYNLGLEEDDPDPPTGPIAGSTDELSCDSIVDKHVDGKIGAMQWILCPTMDNTRYTASWVDNITEDWLTLDAGNYNNKTVRTVWSALRNVANVLMVAFLLVIIMSQLTGRGIDNYGIKKMLPRLIVMAIIVNLSLYICQIAVDLSNIAGVGLRNMFGAVAMDATDSSLRGTSFLGLMMTGIFAAAPAVGTAAGVGAAISTLTVAIAPAVIIAVIVLFLVILVGVVTLFLMLAAREIIVILCIILSPLAFAAFILPNTQNISKKWWDLFKAALIMFPLCGAMSGISYLLRSMAVSGVELNVWGFAIMMVLPYLGFFLLPMLLKNALAALGKVGGALTALGNTVRNGGRQLGQTGTRAVQNSQRFKDWQQYRQEQTAAQRAQRIHDRLSGRTGLTQRQQSQLRSADDILLAQRKKNVENASRASGDFYDAALAKQDLAVANEQRSTELYNDPNYRQMMEQHGQIALSSEREKMWSERFADQDKVTNSTNLRNALVGQDADQAAAAFNTLNSQGISETMTELYNADWNSMNSDVRNKVLTRMASSNVDSFKSFAKYRQSGGQKSFSDWMNGAGPVETGVKDATYASHLNDLKEHAMDSYSKDEIEFINNNAANSLQAQLGSQGFGSMLRSAALNSKDPKAQTQAEDIMRKQIERGTMSVSNLGLTAENLGSMRGETINAVRQGYINNFQNRGYNLATASREADRLIRYELGSQIAQARADNRIYNRMNSGVKDVLGI